MGIPAAFLGAVIVMSIFGMSVNMITLFSFILALGLVVDDSIVVTENVYRHMLKGTPPGEAAVVGTNQVVAPVVSATLTTVSAFLPMLLMKGMLGKFNTGRQNPARSVGMAIEKGITINYIAESLSTFLWMDGMASLCD